MADACYLACSEYFENGEWHSSGLKIPSVYISVELDKEELQTMAVAFIADVSESKILKGRDAMDIDERTRVAKAIRILRESELYLEYLPDYSMKDVENCIKRNIRVNKTQVIMFDYITTSMKIIEEIAKASSGMKVREDQILFLLSSKLKDIASKFNVFIMSSTQLNGKTEKNCQQLLILVMARGKL